MPIFNFFSTDRNKNFDSTFCCQGNEKEIASYIDGGNNVVQFVKGAI